MKITVVEFEKVYSEYYQKLFSFVYKFVQHDEHKVHDIVQETFHRLCNQNYNDIKDRIAPWLFTVSRNITFKKFNKDKKIVFQDLREYDDAAPDYSPSEQLIISEESELDVGLLQTAMLRLSQKSQRIIRLRFYDNLKYEEIAELENTTSGNVGFILSTGIKRLRKVYMRLQKENKKRIL